MSSGKEATKSENSSNYKLVYHPRAVKFLKKLTRKEAQRVVDKIEKLQSDPHTTSLDTKRLVTSVRSYRLRVGEMRVIFEVDEEGKMIYIHEIGFRGGVY